MLGSGAFFHDKNSLCPGHVVDAIGQEWSLLMFASYGCNELQAFHHVLKCYDHSDHTYVLQKK